MVLTMNLLFLQALTFVVSQAQWQNSPELYREDFDTGKQLYYSPEFYSEYDPGTDYYREYYLSASAASKDYYWRSYDAKRKIYSQEVFVAKYDDSQYFSNSDAVIESELSEFEAILIASVSSLILLVITVCICRFFCVAKRLTKLQKEESLKLASYQDNEKNHPRSDSRVEMLQIVQEEAPVNETSSIDDATRGDATRSNIMPVSKTAINNNPKRVNSKISTENETQKAEVRKMESQMIKSGLRTLNRAEREIYQANQREQFNAAVTNEPRAKGHLMKKQASGDQHAKQSPRRLGIFTSGRQSSLQSGRGTSMRVEDIIEEAAADRELDSSNTTPIKASQKASVIGKMLQEEESKRKSNRSALQEDAQSITLISHADRQKRRREANQTPDPIRVSDSFNSIEGVEPENLNADYTLSQLQQLTEQEESVF